MPISLISLNGNTVSVVSLPATPAFESLDWTGTTSVGVVTSIFTGQVQVQLWPGADNRSGVATLPPMTKVEAKPWKAALLQLQGMANGFFLGDPLGVTPDGVVQGSPAIDGSIPVEPGTTTIYSLGWVPSQTNLLLPFDYIQIGYRLYTVLDVVSSDASGKAPINIWPSLRETPINGETIATSNAQGLFRLAKNGVTWSEDFTKLTHISFSFQEYR